MWQSPVVIAAPTAGPLSLAAAKEFLRLDADDTAFDGEVTVHLTGACQRIEQATGTRLMTQVVSLGAGSFADLARLPIGPVQSVDSITYVDPAGAEQELAEDAYELFGAELECGIRPTFGRAWPIAANRPGAITVEATLGYASLPPAIRVALLLTVRALFDDRSADVEAWLVNHRINA
jgi:uncharacterized phiE125 gp8 family phage protein